MISDKKVYILTNGCPRRAIDSSRVGKYFKANNCVLVNQPNSVNYIVFVSCAFKKSKEDESIRLINCLKKYSGELIVLGCLPGINEDRLKKVFPGRFLSTKEHTMIDRFFPEYRVSYSVIPDIDDGHYTRLASFSIHKIELLLTKSVAYIEPMNFHFSKGYLYYVFKKVSCLLKQQSSSRSCPDRTPPDRKYDIRATQCQVPILRISHGCASHCSFCGIRKAIGTLKSKSIDHCVSDCRKLVNKGCKRIAITGDDTGAYGVDVKRSLPDLLEELSPITQADGIRWQILEMHPRWTIRYKNRLLEYIKRRQVELVDCPIQSGSNKMLRLMKRYHTADEIAETLLEFRNANPDLLITTHIMIGFPGEDDGDLKLTLKQVKKVHFNNVLVFPYSDSKNALSYTLEGKIAQERIFKRVKETLEFLSQNNICYGLV